MARGTELIPRQVARRIVRGAVVTAGGGVLLGWSGHGFDNPDRRPGMTGETVVIVH